MDTWKKLATLVAAGALVFAVSGVAFAASVTPTTHDGNITADGGGNSDAAACDIDDTVSLGNGNDSGTSANGVTVTQTYDESTKETSFTATGGVVTIAYIKGGSAYNMYDYRPDGVASDSGLVAPENASGGSAGLSHAVYCTAVEETEESEEPSFEASEEAETDEPTEPPTNTVGGGTSGPADSAWLLVVALGVFLASVVVLTPARAKSR